MQTLLNIMVSLKRLLYIIGTVTGDDDTKYMSFNEICSYFDENCDHSTLLSRVRSQVNAHKNLFAIKRIGRNIFWRLNANGKNYLNKFKDAYDPNTDRMLFQPEKIEVF